MAASAATEATPAQRPHKPPRGTRAPRAREKANIDTPDYSSTLGEMALHLDAATKTLKIIAGKPAMGLIPEHMAQRMDQSARQGRQSDREQISTAQNRYDHAARD